MIFGGGLFYLWVWREGKYTHIVSSDDVAMIKVKIISVFYETKFEISKSSIQKKNCVVPHRRILGLFVIVP